MVIEALQAAGLPVKKVDAVADFEQATVKIDGKKHGPLVNVTGPEEKRKIIGKAFIDIQNRLVAELKLTEALLLQGTNAADRIESGHSTGDSHTMTIKTHHNQVREVQELKSQGLLIEPIDDLFKDEIRELGRQLGLPEELVERQPFPGPGTAIRIIAAAKSQADLKPAPEQAAIQAFLDKQSKRHQAICCRSAVSALAAMSARICQSWLWNTAASTAKTWPNWPLTCRPISAKPSTGSFTRSAHSRSLNIRSLKHY